MFVGAYVFPSFSIVSMHASLLQEMNYFGTLYVELLLWDAAPPLFWTLDTVCKWITRETKEEKEAEHKKKEEEGNSIMQLSV